MESVEVDALDNQSWGKDVTFIKMDVEGFESNAILGAKRILQEQQPKLAISVYHRPEDIWALPLLILDINPNYKFYLRHYSLRNTETVLYGI